MLPAISADLPAYLVPPKATGDGAPTSTDDSRFGPSTQVELSSERAIDAQSRAPGTGIYGPDGRFVEAAARKDLQEDASQMPSMVAEAAGEDTTTVENTTTPPDSSAPRELRPDTAAERRQGSARLSAEEQTVARERDLALADFDSIIPPAARAELNALADRVSRAAEGGDLGSRELKQIAHLMTAVGRYDEAYRATSMAEEIEKAGQDKDLEEAPRAPDPAGQEAGAAEDTEA